VLRIVRSASLSVWATAYLRGQADVPTVLAAVTGDDEPHLLRVESAHAIVGPDPAPGDLAELLVAARLSRAHRFRLVLAVPGDPLGLPGPAAFDRAAMHAQEAVVIESETGEPMAGLVPDVTVFGSRWEPGAQVTWTLHPVGTNVATTRTVSEADRELREAIIVAGSTLAELDLVDLDEDSLGSLARLRHDDDSPASALPAHTVPRSVHVLSTAWRMRLLVDLALSQGRGTTPVDARGQAKRIETLRALDDVARRAVVTAINTAVPTDATSAP
jgi:hypothetical protein